MREELNSHVDRDFPLLCSGENSRPSDKGNAVHRGYLYEIKSLPTCLTVNQTFRSKLIRFTSTMESSQSRRISKLIISLCTLISTSFAILISILIISYIVLHHFRRKNLRKPQRVSLLLTCNTCFAIICASSTLTWMTVSTLIGDFNLQSWKWMIFSACALRGYLHFVFVNAIYLSYVLQAGYRLFRIAFHEYKFLRSISSFTFYIVLQWILSFLLILPILIARPGYSSLISYLPDEFYCQVPMTSIRGIVFSILTVYFLPVCCIGIIYLWIIIYIRQRSQPLVMMIISVRRQTKRDRIILRRICLVMIVLLSLGIPSTIFVLNFIRTKNLFWASYRLGWMTIAISFALISLSSLYVTPQIHRSIRNFLLKRNPPGNNVSHSSLTQQKSTRQRKNESFLLKSSTTIG